MVADNPGLFFCFFGSFQRQILQKENCRRQQDSNSYRWSRRQARWSFDHHHHHGPPLTIFKWSTADALRSLFTPLVTVSCCIASCVSLKVGLYGFHWSKLGLFLIYFRLLFNTVDRRYNFHITGFELWISGVCSNRSTNWASYTHGPLFQLNENCVHLRNSQLFSFNSP